MTMMKRKKTLLLGLSGSLREGSYGTAVLRTIADRLDDRATLEIFPLNNIPLYNQDHDLDHPLAAVGELRSSIRRACGLIVISPEYNHGMSGVLKNALDWASRPYGQSSLAGKPVLTMTASPAFTGGVRAQLQLNETLAAASANVLVRPQTVIPAVHEKIRDGRLADQQTLAFILVGVDDLLRATAERDSSAA